MIRFQLILFRILISVILALPLLTNSATVVSGQSDYPIYIVKSGDSLSTIAARFHVTVDEIVSLNGITDPNILNVGTELKIPGLNGLSGIITTRAVPFGESLWSLDYLYQLSTDTIVDVNRITSPNEIYAGTELIVNDVELESKYSVSELAKDQLSLLETGIKQNSNIWELAIINHKDTIVDFLPGEQIRNYSEKIDRIIGPYEPISSIEINPLPIAQGNTIEIKILSGEPLSITGKLGNYPLNFFSNGQYSVALQGIHRDAEMGLATLTLQATLPDGNVIRINQPLLMAETYFRTDKPLTVPPETIDPANTQPEEDQIRSITSPTTPTKYWDGKFVAVNDEPECITAWYGDGRVYNGTFRSFHTGIDYGVCAKPSLNIYSPAAGVVVYVGALTVRGNATIIDHGWGIYSGFWHQKETLVQIGDQVTAGQLIGYIGATGRASGPHLHWEVWVNGNQVNPLDWLANIYP